MHQHPERAVWRGPPQAAEKRGEGEGRAVPKTHARTEGVASDTHVRPRTPSPPLALPLDPGSETGRRALRARLSASVSRTARSARVSPPPKEQVLWTPWAFSRPFDRTSHERRGGTKGETDAGSL